MRSRSWLVAIILFLMVLTSVSLSSAQDSSDLTIAQILLSSSEDRSNPLSSFGQIFAFEDRDTMTTLFDDPNTEMTLFVPTSEAIDAFLQGPYQTREMKEMSLQLGFARTILDYHVADTVALTYEDLEAHVEAGGVIGGRVATRQGQILNITNIDGALVIDGHASILRDDSEFTLTVQGAQVNVSINRIHAANGVIHVIDTVLLPTSDPILQVLEDVSFDFDGQFSFLLQALNQADPEIKARLADPHSITTLFAATDEAFLALGEDTLNQLLGDQEKLNDILRYHTAVSTVPTSQMIWLISQDRDNAEIETNRGLLFGPNELRLRRNEAGYIVLNGQARIIVADVDAGNGLIHVVDAVLEPPE